MGQPSAPHVAATQLCDTTHCVSDTIYSVSDTVMCHKTMLGVWQEPLQRACAPTDTTADMHVLICRHKGLPAGVPDYWTHPPVHDYLFPQSQSQKRGCIDMTHKNIQETEQMGGPVSSRTVDFMMYELKGELHVAALLSVPGTLMMCDADVSDCFLAAARNSHTPPGVTLKRIPPLLGTTPTQGQNRARNGLAGDAEIIFYEHLAKVLKVPPRCQWHNKSLHPHTLQPVGASLLSSLEATGKAGIRLFFTHHRYCTFVLGSEGHFTSYIIANAASIGMAAAIVQNPAGEQPSGSACDRVLH